MPFIQFLASSAPCVVGKKLLNKPCFAKKRYLKLIHSSACTKYFFIFILNYIAQVLYSYHKYICSHDFKLFISFKTCFIYWSADTGLTIIF